MRTAGYRRRGVAALLALLTIFPTLLLLYAVAQDRAHNRLAEDTFRAGSLRYRAIRLAVLTSADGAFGAQLGRPAASAADAAQTFRELQDIHDHLRQNHPLESGVVEPAWQTLVGEWKKSGHVRWKTAETLREASNQLVGALSCKLKESVQRERRYLEVGALATLFSLAASVALLLSLRQTEKRLQAEQRFTNTVLDTTGALVLVLDIRTGRIVRFNRACEVITAYSADEAIADTRPFYEWLVPPAERAAVCEVFGRLQSGDFPLHFENDWQTRDGRRRRIAWLTTVLTDTDRPAGVVGAATAAGSGGETSYIIATGVDVTVQRAYENDLRAANARLQEQAATDSLTGLANRRALDTRLEAEWERATRYGLPLSLLLIDVDHFKPYNDAFGHPAGDEALCQIADILTKAARDSDLVARVGGEEFAVLLPHADRADALATGERMRMFVAAAAWPRRPITISVGVATRAISVPDRAALIASADKALYAAKTERNALRHATQVRLDLPPPASGGGVTVPAPVAVSAHTNP